MSYSDKRAAPRRINFVLLAPTTEEAAAAQDVLGLPYWFFHPDLALFEWGFVPSADDAARASVALVSLREDYGALRAASATKAIVEALAPDYLLIVGHALGLSPHRGEVSSGDVVVSHYLHVGEYRTEKTGSLFRSPLRLSRIAHPDDLLVKLAGDVAPRFGQPHGFMQLDADGASGIRIIVDKEMVCGPELQDQPDNDTLVRLVNCFPRVRAYDMESGGVATTLYDLGRPVPGYLMVKGISDCYDYEPRGGVLWPTRDTLCGNNTAERRKWRVAAARHSVEFARALVRHYVDCMPRQRPIEIGRLLPERTKTVQINRDCAGVLHRVTPIDLSHIIDFNVMKAEQEGLTDQRLFTVCALEPGELWAVLESLYVDHGGSPVNPANQSERREFLRWTRTQLPHLTTFQNRAGSSTRVLLLRDERFVKRIRPEHWELFQAINGKVDCKYLVRSRARHLRFMTDWTLVGDHLVLDYYFESATVIISEVRADDIREEVLSLYQGLVSGGADADLFRSIDELSTMLTSEWQMPKGNDPTGQ